MRPSDAHKRYRRSDLERFTTHQLREICRHEKIIKGVLKPLDKDELIHVILQYRGMSEPRLITTCGRDGLKKIEELLASVSLAYQQHDSSDGRSSIIVYAGVATSYFDHMTIPYDERLCDTNALIVSDDHKVCGVFNVVSRGVDCDQLYLIKDRNVDCYEVSSHQKYSLYCFDQKTSEILFYACHDQLKHKPTRLVAYRFRLLQFSVREKHTLNLPVAIDFGSTNTAAGVYLDHHYLEQRKDFAGRLGMKEGIHYATYYDTTKKEAMESVLLPSIVAVSAITDGAPSYVFGYDALSLEQAIYTGEPFTIFHDIKRWVIDYEKEEVLIDGKGRRTIQTRKEILKAFFTYVIHQVEDRFKCRIPSLHISAPVKQKGLFAQLFREILPEFQDQLHDPIDEGMTVLYHTISKYIGNRHDQNKVSKKALILDCGGGTTDLCSCTYTILDHRVSYEVSIKSVYENGDANFGGNHLTYRILQWIKVLFATRLTGHSEQWNHVMQRFHTDSYRFVDEHGAAAFYSRLDEASLWAEQMLPTQFASFEYGDRVLYFQVRTNFHYLFQVAESVKKIFSRRLGTARIHLGSQPQQNHGGENPNGSTLGTRHLAIDRFKLSVVRDGEWTVLKDIPDLYLDGNDLALLLKAEIYGIISTFFEPLYETDSLYDFDMIKLSGQSCTMGLFADAVKEFVPGKLIRLGRDTSEGTENETLSMKLACVDGAIAYLKDQQYGYVKASIETGLPALPYSISAIDHHGEMITLIHRLDREHQQGSISRTMNDITLTLHLNDYENVCQYTYTYFCQQDEFQETTYDEIYHLFHQIPQAETDIILDGEVKFFVWADHSHWGFRVVPITRLAEGLKIGKQDFFPFEHDAWLVDLFDGHH